MRSHKWERLDQIITAITEEGPLTYSELLPKMPGLTTEEHVRNIVSTGRKWGVLQKLTGDGDLPKERTKGKAGATRFVEISRPAGCVVGLNVGRTYFAIGVADPNGRLLSTFGEPPGKDLNGKAKDAAWKKYREGQMIVHDRTSGLRGLPLLKGTAKKTVEWLGMVGVADEEVRGITLSLPTPVSTTKSKSLTSSIEPSLAAVRNIERQFKLALGKDRYPNLEKVVLANDADVAARGEVRYGKAHGKRDVVAIHAAYGVGAGIITDGKILRTGAGGGAGEIGHCMPTIFSDEGRKHGLPALDPDDEVFTCVCGCPGHLEAMAGGEAIVRRIAKAGNTLKPKPPKRLAKVLNDPDKTVAVKLDAVLKASSGKRPWKPGQAALVDSARLLGGAVHTITHLFNPEAVYLSGKLSEAGKPFLEEVQEAFEELGSLSNYSPSIELGTATGAFHRRLIMVRGAAMTAVRSTESLVTEKRLKELEKQHA
jgi:predicted NBD/HSP70 family sugar kinase